MLPVVTFVVKLSPSTPRISNSPALLSWQNVGGTKIPASPPFQPLGFIQVVRGWQQDPTAKVSPGFRNILEPCSGAGSRHLNLCRSPDCAVASYRHSGPSRMPGGSRVLLLPAFSASFDSSELCCITLLHTYLMALYNLYSLAGPALRSKDGTQSSEQRHSGANCTSSHKKPGKTPAGYQQLPVVEMASSIHL